jgi:ferredoxin
MRVVIDYAKCIGAATCADICPEVFEMGDDGLAHVINEQPGPELVAKVNEAIAECPTSAIHLEE